MYGFQAQGNYYPVDSFLLEHLTLLLDEWHHCPVGHLFLLELLFSIVGVKDFTVILV